MGYLSSGEIFDFGTPQSLLTFKPLSLTDKIDFARSVLKMKREKSLDAMDKVSAVEWLTEHAGERVFNVLWKPLLIQKFGIAYLDVPMAWIWRKVHIREPSKKNIFSGEKLAYLDGSLRILIDKLQEIVISSGAELALSTKIKSINYNIKPGLQIITKKSNERFDAVVSTVSPQILDKLVTFPGKFNTILRNYKQLSAICIMLVLDRQLTDYYWLNIGDNSFPFGLIVEHTNYLPPDKYNNRHIIYLSKYYDASHEKYDSFNDKKIVEYFLTHLNRINKNFKRDWIEEVHVSRGKHAQPVITKDYLSIKPNYTTTLPNLYWISMNHIYPDDRGVNCSIQMAEDVCDVLSESISNN